MTSDFLPALEGFPSRGLIVPLIDSLLHLSFEGQSSGSENHSHLKGGLSSITSSPLKERRDDWYSSHSLISLVELGRSVISITKRNFDKEVFNLCKGGYPSPPLEGARLSAPLTPFFISPLSLRWGTGISEAASTC